jgi:hypothetical protein
MISAGMLCSVITRAADASDRDDVATRRLLANVLGTIATTCPRAGEGTSTAEDGDACALGGRLTVDCRDCVLSRQAGAAFARLPQSARSRSA